MDGSEFNIANLRYYQASLQNYIVDIYDFRTRAQENNQGWRYY